MRSISLLLTLSLAATFVAFVAPPADACAGTSCIPGCQYQCPPGCGDNVPCCDPGDTIVECFVGTCTPSVCVESVPCLDLLGCPFNVWCNHLYCYTPPPLSTNPPCTEITCSPLPGCGDNIPCCDNLLDCPIVYIP